ncbi:SDR family oxidoreductase [uncultured Methylobacterium sp.]|jgi:NAD(P)-dependent dehydrogenase (short-subunit alcohol dehydrogenase family)|uniref:SDR family NAD(P)-dependent oxidoreductase n=1 Tax=uncultured Methylobacterium sp. TaxID=157278 RepID=UPI0026321DFD|nr:SDR family oxidoreductase [uncultured Methylobacterium sp.]
MSRGQIIVTGASRGIGAAIAADLDGRGFTVAALSRSGTAPAGYGVACDMADEDAIAAAVAQVAARGPVVGLVNNAGAHEAEASAGLSAAAFERTMRLNATAVVVACREVHPHLKAAGSGLIVNIGSFFDRMGVTGNVAYCASKAAVGAITRCLAAEWARDGIRVLDVAPGYVETDLNRDYLAREKVRAWMETRIPVGRPGRPEEVARLVGILFAEPVRFLTGETIYVDGGQGHHH